MTELIRVDRDDFPTFEVARVVLAAATLGVAVWAVFDMAHTFDRFQHQARRELRRWWR